RVPTSLPSPPLFRSAVGHLRPPRLHRRRGGALPACIDRRPRVGQLNEGHVGQAPHLPCRCRACLARGFTGKATCGASPASTTPGFCDEPDGCGGFGGFGRCRPLVGTIHRLAVKPHGATRRRHDQRSGATVLASPNPTIAKLGACSPLPR